MPTTSYRTATSRRADEDLALLFHPSRRYRRPADVLADPALSIGERRALLSAWASDACAVDSVPALRRPPFAAEPVSFDEIMDALRQLDRETMPQPRKGGRHLRGQPAMTASVQRW